MSGTDSSSEDENLTLLREAVDNDLITDSMYSKSAAKATEDVKPTEQLKSLRNTNNDDDDQFSTFKVTPQFQNYVARHLEKMLEESLSKQLKSYPPNAEDIPNRKRKKNRIKLLSDSKHCLKVTDENVDNRELVNSINAKNAKYRMNKNYDSDENLDKFKTVAVSPETVLAQTEVSHWAKRRKRQVFAYKKLKDGKLHNVEECKYRTL